MTYAMLYVDNASVIATFEGAREATDSLNEFVREHPDLRDDVALVALDSRRVVESATTRTPSAAASMT